MSRWPYRETLAESRARRYPPRTLRSDLLEIRLGGYAVKTLALLSAVFALVLIGCAEAPPRPDAPWVGNMKFTPSTFTLVNLTELSFDYRNIRGGISKSTVSFDYQGSLPNHTRKPSTFVQNIQMLGGASESGTFRTSFRIAPSDPPPFDISYYLRITDAEGRRSNEAEANVSYRPM